MTRQAASVRLSLAGIALAGITSGCSGERADQAPKPDERCEMPRDLASLPAPSLVYSHPSLAIDYFSPRAADLDADGELEIVATGGSESPPHGEVVALDGPSGEMLWRVEAEQQLYSSGVFVDVTGDGVKDVFVGGRNQTFFGVDGASGARLWTFVDPRPLPEYYLYNFYTAVPIDDLTGDGVQELLVSNGGSDAINEPGAPRPPGHLVVLDARTGELVAVASSPDHEEMYMSPLLVPDAGTSSPSILFGTGGETRHGGLWRTTLDDVLAGDIGTAKRLVDVVGKGVIAPPALGDLDGDERLDIIVATFDGRLIALSGANDETLWELVFDAAETFSTPALGYFDDDDVPDVFAVFLHGVFPDYDSVERVVVSGRDGGVLWRGQAGTFTMAGDVALDLDGDDRDEVVFSSNDWNAEPGTENTLHLIDTVSSNERPWGMPLGSPSSSSPWVGDLDADGCVDLVVATHTPPAETNEAAIERFRVAAPVPARISWGGYLGTRFDSILQRRP
ncbi:MAG TPA: PQQ-binding-like beta-propeller repeat protein [Polyangiaceae bacterium]|nr:PQQ-binding-like beta-propeller repeat protein [Polyangiaceae bacterium]